MQTTPCHNYTPVVQSEDPCNGKITNAQCVLDSTVYMELGLEANSSQQEINQAIYVALQSLLSQVEALQNQIDSMTV